MIPLTIRATTTSSALSFLARLNFRTRVDWTNYDWLLVEFLDDGAVFEGPLGTLRVFDVDPFEIDGDVIWVSSVKKSAQRLIRASSRQNTLLVTEQCDQLCIMCSQPPKARHNDRFEMLTTACVLAPHGMTIGISGGEPGLYKVQLFAAIQKVASTRPDLHFHILTNGQHFQDADVTVMRSTAFKNVLWGIPLYSADEEVHDRVVGKVGAFKRLPQSFVALLKAGANIELRTVVLKQNIGGLADLAKFISTRLPFIRQWSIMQLENIGFARQNWEAVFFDHSLDFDPIARGIVISKSRGIATSLFNFPLCTLPEAYRTMAPITISDWKRRYLDVCHHCTKKADCTGFFEWYNTDNSFQGIAAL